MIAFLTFGLLGAVAWIFFLHSQLEEMKKTIAIFDKLRSNGDEMCFSNIASLYRIAHLISDRIGGPKFNPYNDTLLDLAQSMERLADQEGKRGHS